MNYSSTFFMIFSKAEVRCSEIKLTWRNCFIIKYFVASRMVPCC